MSADESASTPLRNLALERSTQLLERLRQQRDDLQQSGQLSPEHRSAGLAALDRAITSLEEVMADLRRSQAESGQRENT